MDDKIKNMEPNTSILLSVIIPVFNGEKTIARAINSVIGKSIGKTEIIVANDGSTDRTEKIVSSYVSPNIRLVNLEKNMGVSSALNKALDIAKGEYISFIDADDWVEPDFLDTINMILSNSSTDMIIFGMRNVDSYGSKDIFPDLNVDNIISEYIVDHITCSRVNKIYKRSILNEYNIRFQNMRRGEDGLFNMEYFFYVNKVNVLNKVIYNYDRRELSITRQAYSFDIITIHEDMISKDLTIIRKHSKDYNNELFVRRFRFIVIHSIFSLYYDWRNKRLDDDLLKKVKKYIFEQFKFFKIMNSKYITLKEKILYLSFIVSPRISFFLLKLFNY